MKLISAAAEEYRSTGKSREDNLRARWKWNGKREILNDLRIDATKFRHMMSIRVGSGEISPADSSKSQESSFVIMKVQTLAHNLRDSKNLVHSFKF